MWRVAVVASTVMVMAVPHLAGLALVTALGVAYAVFLWALLKEAR